MALLKGKTVLITGGTAGIGKSIGKLFAKNGANVIVFGTNPKRAEEAVLEIEQERLDTDQLISSEVVDVSKSALVKEALDKVLKTHKTIDVLINNAGITRDNLLIRMSEEDWDTVVDVNLKSVYNTCRVLVRPMMKARAGKIINITSVIGLTGNSGQVNYAASKSGMIGFTKSLAKELASRNVCVNCIAPGYIQTRMTEGLPDPVKATILEKIPLSRIGDSKDVANAALFLASDMSDYVTGQVLTVDGGMVM